MRANPDLDAVKALFETEAIGHWPWLQVIDSEEVVRMASENATGEVPSEEGVEPWRSSMPTVPLILRNVRPEDITSIQTWLSRYYPAQHPIQPIYVNSKGSASKDSIPVSRLANIERLNDVGAFYVPPLAAEEDLRTFAGLMNLTRRLRAPGGCPWDREQTHDSLKPHLLEEAYEVIDALDRGDPELLCKELGDLLFQVTIHSQVAAESESFTIEDVIERVMRKLIGRHPHVFGDLRLESAHEVLSHWESFKQGENPERESILQEIPEGLPALPQSTLMQKRAASIGFEWPSATEVIAKVEEELEELRTEISQNAPSGQKREELGDIFFALVSLARHLKLDPEEALREANRKFATRFQQVEALAGGEQRHLRDLSPEELDSYWEQAKGSDRRG